MARISLVARLLCISRLTCAICAICAMCACDGGSEDETPGGDLAYFCEHYSLVYCEAYAECDLFNFYTYFESVEECSAQTEGDCLEPPVGHPRCDAATPEETDICVEYFASNFPVGCENLFGPSKDLSLCEDICE